MNRVLVGDCRETLKDLPDCSVHCCVTSPPYWGLRDYGVEGQIGLEKTPAEYVSKLVAVLSEVRRVLRGDGTFWLNIGDSYATGGGAVGRCPGGGDQGERFLRMGHINTQPNRMKLPGLKKKELVGIPWMLAFALRDDGWSLRQEIIWHKPNPMPGSMKDRCTTSHEHIFLLTKQARYYYDWYAISEPCTHFHEAKYDPGTNGHTAAKSSKGSGKSPRRFGGNRRNKRSVWKFSNRSYKGPHFAAFPPKLPELCILAGSPDRCCSKCGKGWPRVIERERVATRPGTNTKIAKHEENDGARLESWSSANRVGNRDPQRHTTVYKDLGFPEPGCQCGAEPVASVVLDPFVGSGATLAVAQRLGRDGIGCELNPEYVKQIEKRVQQKELSL